MVVDPEVLKHLSTSSHRGPLSELTPRELEVLQLMAEGLSSGEIGERLVLSSAAVFKHIANVFLKLGLPVTL